MNTLINCLVLADGTILENSSGGYADRNLWCWINGKTMNECYALFTDPEKTKTITVNYATSQIIYKGFTELLLIKKGTDGFDHETVDVRLTWPEGGEHEIIEVVPVDEELHPEAEEVRV